MKVFTTQHGSRRLQQRGIARWVILELLQHGDRIYRHGLIFYYMPKREIERYYPPQKRKELRGLVVLISEDGLVITAYKNSSAVHRAKRKRKRNSEPKKYEQQNKRSLEILHLPNRQAA
jgi:hypothetical protein